MKSINQIAHLIIDNLKGGQATTDSDLHPIDVQMRVRQAANELLKIEIFNRQKDGDRQAPTQAIATYEVDVKSDSARSYRYSELPENFLSLSYNRGIHNIIPKKSTKEHLIRSNSPYVASKLRVASNEHNSTYYQEGNRIIYKGDNFNKLWDKMFVQLIIIAPDSYDADTPLPLLPGQESQIMRMVTADLQPSIQVPSDEIDDGKDRPTA